MSVSEEARLVERLRGGDSAALEILMSAYASRVYRLAFGITRDHADAEEVAQDVFLTLATKSAMFEGRARWRSACRRSWRMVTARVIARSCWRTGRKILSASFSRVRRAKSRLHRARQALREQLTRTLAAAEPPSAPTGPARVS
jgi:DNA-directed RNA polymerase specialized sigma24 family protein